MGLLQDLSDIIELDVFVFVHGFVPNVEGEAHSKKNHSIRFVTGMPLQLQVGFR